MEYGGCWSWTKAKGCEREREKEKEAKSEMLRAEEAGAMIGPNKG